MDLDETWQSDGELERVKSFMRPQRKSQNINIFFALITFAVRLSTKLGRNM